MIPLFDMVFDLLDEGTVLRYARFTKSQICLLVKVFGFEKNMTFPNRIRCRREIAMYYKLYRLGSHSTFAKDVQAFGRSETWLCTIFNGILLTLHHKYQEKLLFDPLFLTRERLWKYAADLARNGCPMTYVFGFVDGTMRRVCRPVNDIMQSALYSGYKFGHYIKYQAVVAPDGLVISLEKASFGSAHDSTMWSNSAYVNGLSIVSNYVGNIHRPLTPEQVAFNRFMASKRIAVENVFADIVKSFSVMANQRILRTAYMPVVCIFPVMTLLQNIRVCAMPECSSARGNFPDVTPPTVEEYLHWDGTDLQDTLVYTNISS